MKNQKMITALQSLKDAHNQVRTAWNETDLNETTAIKRYPFATSFDELNVDEWVDKTISELQQTNYKIHSHSYTNTGGGCMVSTFRVWLPDENRTMFVHVNEEGGTLATCDYINEEIDYDDSMMEYNFSTQYLTNDNKYFELFKYCVIEYAKRDCKRYGYKAKLTYELLPAEIQQELTPEYLDWHYENVGDDFETDGYELFLSEDYEVGDQEIIKAKELLQYMDDEMKKTDVEDNEQALEKFYGLQATITFGEKTFTTENCAAIYNAIQSCMKEFIDNY